MRVGGLELICPVCRGPLTDGPQSLACGGCARDFPIVAGIPDLRVAPDPWIDFAEDRLKALRVLKEAEGLDFAGHVRTYWGLTPTTSTEQAEGFIDHVLRATTRSRQWLDAGLGPAKDADRTGTWLDLGCGTADLAVAAPEGVEVISVDIAMRWLVVARRRLQETGRPCHLICANAEALPFATESTAHVVSLGMLEHCQDLGAVAREARRVLAPGGSLRARTVNRFSMLPEPHVGVWGVGLLPRAWANRYVRWRSGLAYQHHFLWSPGALRRGLKHAGFARVRVRAATTLQADLERAGGLVRMLTPTYELARKIPFVGRAVTTVAPLLDVAAEGTR